MRTLPEFTDEFFTALQTNVHKDCSSCNVTLELKPHLAELLTNLSDEVSTITIGKSSVAEQLGMFLCVNHKIKINQSMLEVTPIIISGLII